MWTGPRIWVKRSTWSKCDSNFGYSCSNFKVRQHHVLHVDSAVLDWNSIARMWYWHTYSTCTSSTSKLLKFFSPIMQVPWLQRVQGWSGWEQWPLPQQSTRHSPFLRGHHSDPSAAHQFHPTPSSPWTGTRLDVVGQNAQFGATPSRNCSCTWRFSRGGSMWVYRKYRDCIEMPLMMCLNQWLHSDQNVLNDRALVIKLFPKWVFVANVECL